MNRYGMRRYVNGDGLEWYCNDHHDFLFVLSDLCIGYAADSFYFFRGDDVAIGPGGYSILFLMNLDLEYSEVPADVTKSLYLSYTRAYREYWSMRDKDTLSKLVSMLRCGV